MAYLGRSIGRSDYIIVQEELVIIHGKIQGVGGGWWGRGPKISDII